MTYTGDVVSSECQLRARLEAGLEYIGLEYIFRMIHWRKPHSSVSVFLFTVERSLQQQSFRGS